MDANQLLTSAVYMDEALVNEFGTDIPAFNDPASQAVFVDPSTYDGARERIPVRPREKEILPGGGGDVTVTTTEIVPEEAVIVDPTDIDKMIVSPTVNEPEVIVSLPKGPEDEAEPEIVDPIIIDREDPEDGKGKALLYIGGALLIGALLFRK